ncbi:hypothetical protein [Saccharothrix longispora]|uniref:hypothetical protein n=1 Tax=Saccharothrix longispora TaxID=33920 RepID=UPI0028FCFE06|nr:hypothetical protein [Saccharothrix longispora]MBY8850270.1 hypothetical protein [Saccharothrix sp. MB29]MDU0288415.1 hypothetical protein [Saccharothrix longispora]
MRIVTVTTASNAQNVNVVSSEEVLFDAGEARPGTPAFGYDGYAYALIADNPDGTSRFSRTRSARPATDHSASPARAALLTWLAAHREATFAELTAHAATLAAVPADLLEQLAHDLFVPAVRFADPAHLAPKSGTTTTWSAHRRAGSWPRETLLTAGKHMGENSDASDMLSLATSEAALLRNCDDTVSALIFGGVGGHARTISSFLVPRDSVVTPDDVEVLFPMGVAARRSRNETEVLFYGAGLDRYVVSARPNPYRREHQPALQDTLVDEVEDDVVLPPAPVDADLVVAGAAAFGPAMAAFLGALPANTLPDPLRAGLASLTAGRPARIAVRRAVDPADEWFSDNGGAVKAQWDALLLPYRA